MAKKAQGSSSRRSREDKSQSVGFGQSFGALLQAQGWAAPAEGAQPAPLDAPAAPPSAEAPAAFEPAKAGPLRLALDRKGRGGKTVVRVRGLWDASAPDAARAEPDAEATARLLGDLKRALGCGAQREGDDLIVHGDQLDRVRQWLAQAGYRLR